MLTDVGDGSPLFLFDGDFRLAQETGALLTCFLLGLLYDGVAGVGSFFEDLRLTLTCLLHESLAFLLDVLEPLAGLMGLEQAFVDIAFTGLYHFDDSGEAILGKHEEDNGKRQKHPEQKSQIRGEDCWQFTEIHSQ